MRTGALGVNSSCMNGPVPSPWSRRSSCLAPSGTMLVNLLLMRTGSSTTGFLVVNVTVRASGALIPSGSRNSSTARAPESGLLVQQALEGVDHVGGGEVLAAMEFHAIAQLEGPGQAVVRHAPFGRQLRQDVEIVVDIDQAIIDRERMIGVVAGMHVGGIHRLLLAAPLVSQHLHAFIARGRERRARQPRHGQRADRRAAHQSCQFHRYLPALVVTLRLPSVPRQIPECWTVVRIYRMVG